MKCNCQKLPVILHEVKDPARQLSMDSLRLVKRHPNNPNKFFYQCSVCGQHWEKMANPHHYGYSESWKKLDAIPVIETKP